MERLKRIEPDQIIFAFPAFAFIVSPFVDMLINFYRGITISFEWETFQMIPYLPMVIVCFEAVAIAILILIQKNNIFKSLLRRTATFQTTLLFYMLYLGLVLMSIGVNGFTYYAVYGHPYTKMSMWTYMANVLLFLGFSSLVYDNRVKKFLVTLCCYTASAYALYSLLQYILRPYRGSLRGTYHNSNHYGYYLAVSIALTAAMIVEKLNTVKQNKDKEETDKKEVTEEKLDVIIWCILLFIQCFALGYNNTLGAWIAVFLSHIFLFVVFRIKDGKFNCGPLLPFGVFLAASIISAFFTTSIFTSILKTFFDIGNIVHGLEAADEAGSGRWKIWRLTVKHIIERPVFGNGIEGLLAIITLEGSKTGSPHNEFLEYSAFFGVPAGIAYISGCFSVFLHGLKYKKELNSFSLVCLVGGFSYLVSSFFGVCFYYTVSYPFIFLGLALNFTDKDRQVCCRLNEVNDEKKSEEYSDSIEDSTNDDKEAVSYSVKESQ